MWRRKPKWKPGSADVAMFVGQFVDDCLSLRVSAAAAAPLVNLGILAVVCRWFQKP